MKRAAFAIAALLCSSAAVAAHDCWLAPENYHPALDERVGVRLLVGTDGVGEPILRDEERIVRFVSLAPSASGAAAPESPIVGQEGKDPAGWVRPKAGGPLMLVYNNTPAHIELEAQKFEDYLRSEGLDAIVALRAERGESGKAGSEFYSRCAKALVNVQGDGDGGRPAGAGEFFMRPVGLPLELVPEADPFLLAAAPLTAGESAAPGEAKSTLQPLPLLLLRDGKPLKDALVRAVRLDQSWHAVETPPRARTDAEGRCRITLPGPGTWMLACVDMQPAPAGSDHDYDSLWASLTFEVPAQP